MPDHAFREQYERASGWQLAGAAVVSLALCWDTVRITKSIRATAANNHHVPSDNS